MNIVKKKLHHFKIKIQELDNEIAETKKIAENLINSKEKPKEKSECDGKKTDQLNDYFKSINLNEKNEETIENGQEKNFKLRFDNLTENQETIKNNIFLLESNISVLEKNISVLGEAIKIPEPMIVFPNRGINDDKDAKGTFYDYYVFQTITNFKIKILVSEKVNKNDEISALMKINQFAKSLSYKLEIGYHFSKTDTDIEDGLLVIPGRKCDRPPRTREETNSRRFASRSTDPRYLCWFIASLEIFIDKKNRL
jgi:hypothetical protein